jgi:hypothetical protein
MHCESNYQRYDTKIHERERYDMDQIPMLVIHAIVNNHSGSSTRLLVGMR